MEDKIQNSKLVTLDNVGYPVQALWFIGSETLFGFQIFWIWAYLMKVILIFWLWAYLMKVILSVPDEGYSARTWWRLFWAYLMKVILSAPDEGYSRNVWCALNLISTFLFKHDCNEKCIQVTGLFRFLLARDNRTN